MDELLIPIEYRQDESRQSPGRLVGILLPYETRAGDRPELFEQGSLFWDAEGILVREMHRRDSPILKTVPILDGQTLRIDAELPDTTRGRDVAVSMRGPNPIYTGLSVEFRSLRETRRNGLRIIQHGKLTGGGLVDLPSYTQALAEVRQQGQQQRRRRLWL